MSDSPHAAPHRPSGTHAKTGGELLVESFETLGLTQVFCVPGESFLAALDAMRESSLTLTVCRQEGGAAMMAEAFGKETGKPAVCFVTRGPGATNAASGVHVAEHDGTPMLLCIGQVARGFLGRGAFQEVDYHAMFGGMAKDVVEIHDPARIPEIVARSLRIALSGRPGPVVLVFPEDVLTEKAEARPVAPLALAEPEPSGAVMQTLAAKLARAENPVMILGGARWSDAGIAAIQRFAEAQSLPVFCSFRRQGLFDHLHPNYAGDLGIGPNPAILGRIRQSDLLLLVGGRLAEMPSQGYTLLGVPEPGVPLVHVHPDEAELGRVYRADLAIHATPDAFAEAAAALPGRRRPALEAHVGEAHAAYRAWSDEALPIPGPLQMGAIMVWLRQRLPDDAVITNGAGNYASYVHRYWRFRRPRTQLAPVSGSMGYGLPAAIAAKRAVPERTVVAFAGDGCFMMTGQEFATAVHHGLNVIVIVIDNGMFGTIRMHQERHYPERVVATELTNPDFAALARAYGGHGETVTTTEDFAPAFERAMACGKPALIHVRLDAEAITPTTTLSAIRQAAKNRS